MGLPTLLSRRGRPRGFYSGDVLAQYAANVVSYLKLDEPSGATAADASGNSRTGAYIGVDLAQTGIVPGLNAPFFDGANDTVNWYTASLAAAFNPAAGTLMGWLRPAAASVWADGAIRYFSILGVNTTTNFVGIRKTALGQLSGVYLANSVSLQPGIGTFYTDTAWRHVALTWSTALDETRFFMNGVQTGPTLTGLGVWAGAIANTRAAIGNINGTIGGASSWHGWLSQVALLDIALTPAQIAVLGRR